MSLFYETKYDAHIDMEISQQFRLISYYFMMLSHQSTEILRIKKNILNKKDEIHISFTFEFYN
jgi:hypothetical protein